MPMRPPESRWQRIGELRTARDLARLLDARDETGIEAWAERRRIDDATLATLKRIARR